MIEALLLAAHLAGAPATVTFGDAQGVLDACPGDQTFTGVARGTLESGSTFDLTAASFDVKHPAPGVVDLVLTGSGSVGGEAVNELSYTDRIGDGQGDANGPFASVYTMLASPHALAVWLGGRSMAVGTKHPLPASVLRAFGAKRGHVVVEQAKGGARLKVHVTGGRTTAADGELLVDPKTWLVKSFLVDVRGGVNAQARGCGVCRRPAAP
jgi:hypothetical protein